MRGIKSACVVAAIGLAMEVACVWGTMVDDSDISRGTAGVQSTKRPRAVSTPVKKTSINRLKKRKVERDQSIISYTEFVQSLADLVGEEKDAVFKDCLPQPGELSQKAGVQLKLEKFYQNVSTRLKVFSQLREDLRFLDWSWYSYLDEKEIDDIFQQLQLKEFVSGVNDFELKNFLQSSSGFTTSFLEQIAKKKGALAKLACIEIVFSVAQKILESPVEGK